MEVNVWRAPLFSAALALTAGIVLDRYLAIPLLFSVLTASVALVIWWVTRLAKRERWPLAYLALSGGAVGAAYHHWYEEVYPADDIGNFVTANPRLARLRGVIEEEPIIIWRPPQSPLQSTFYRDRKEDPARDPTHGVLRVSQLRQGDDWVSVSGRVQLVVGAHLEGFHVGDEVEVVGHLAAPHGAANPGERDYAATLLDQRIRAQVVVRKTPDGVTRLAEGWRWSFYGRLAVLRAWGQDRLGEALPPKLGGLAMALLLGDGSTMTNADWQKYIRTGVIHVLAISGQHMVVLAFFLGWLFRLLLFRRRVSGAFAALFLLTYALLVGGRPPVLRSAVMVCALYGGFLLRRGTLPVNAFALAWLVVALLNPADLFTIGCQLSFLAVAMLYWGPGYWLSSERYPLRWGMSLLDWVRDADLPKEKDSLDRFIDERRPLWQKYLRRAGRHVAAMYAIGLVVWLAVVPLVAARYHMISPSVVFIGPLLIDLTSIALIAGFLLLLAAAVCPLLVPLFAWPTRWSLAACDLLVDVADAVPGGHRYVTGLPDWWLWIFYIALLAILTQRTLQRPRHWVLSAGVAWCCVGLITGSMRPASDELRCTFLAVGHGGCTVLETPDGRTLLYDTGAIAGPDVTRLKIAPFLWHRGIRRIDEVFLSHADLDHFNGLPDLLERFVVGQVTCTPTFADKATSGVQYTLAALQQHGIPVRIVRAGDRLSAVNVEMEVLHPPAAGPTGNENARSLVLLVRHVGHTLLLTGDLEGPGLERVLALPAPRIDVLMAPHHGSRVANTPELAAWARPQVVVSCEGPPRVGVRRPEPYTAQGVSFLGTWPHGAITIRSRADALVIDTFQTRQHFVVHGEQNP